jgi:hypothetical protein
MKAAPVFATVVLATVVLAAGLVPAAAGGAVQSGAGLLPSAAETGAWKPSGAPESYERQGLYGYINGGSEVFLQYGFERVDVGRYRKPGTGEDAEITVDIYRMASDRDAFGIFSVRREGDEKKLQPADVPNWISETQASLAAGPYYVNLIGFGTKEADLAAFSRLLAGKLSAAGHRGFSLDVRPGPWSRLPRAGVLPDTVRYIKGPLAAQAESELLAPDFWKFAEGTEAASARYAPDGRKLVVIELTSSSPQLDGGVRSVFSEYLTDVRFEGGILSAKNTRGHSFLFKAVGTRAALVFGRQDSTAARMLLEQAFGK